MGKDKNWGRINMVNQYRMRNREFERLANVGRGTNNGPPTPSNNPLDDGEDNDLMEAADAMDVDPNTGGTETVDKNNIGKGTAIQSGAPALWHIPIKSITIPYRHRQEFRMRNRLAGEWQDGKLWGSGTINPQQHILRYLITDEHCLPSHVLGFYMTKYEIGDLYNPRYRTWNIKKAGFSIEQVQVLPNTLVGTTDLKYAAPLGIQPLAYLPAAHSREYPLWQLNKDDQTATVPNFNPRDGYDGLVNMARAKEDRGNALALMRGYVTRYGAGNVRPECEVQFQGGFNYRLKRDWDIIPITNLYGHYHSNNCWNQSFPIIPPADNPQSTYDKLYYNFGTHNTSARIKQMGAQADNYATGIVSDTRGTVVFNAPAMPLLQTNELMMMPVGPMYNGHLKSSDSLGNPRVTQGHNMPFCVAMQNIPDPDGKPFDYTTTFTIESELIVEYDLDHTGGNGEGVFLVDDYQIYPRVLYGQAHHAYGDGGPMGTFKVHNGPDRYTSMGNIGPSAYGNTGGPTLEDTPFDDLLRKVDVIKNAGFVTQAGPNEELEIPTRRVTRSMTKQNCNV